MARLLKGALSGLAAGAAGTAALDATTYLDMAVRGRPASSTPEDSVERISAMIGVTIPGAGETRENRVAGLGPLLGLVAGASTGAIVGAARTLGLVNGRMATMAATAAVAMLAGNLPMTVTGVTDPRKWSVGDWLADVVPHLAYGSVTAIVLCELDGAP